MGGPENPFAFPFPEVRAPDGTGISEGSAGMTLRDHFAGRALVGLLSGQYSDTGVYNQTELVAESFGIADAMLAARGAA